MPRLSRARGFAPELFELGLVAQRVHRAPETFMRESHQLPVARQALERRAFEGDVISRMRSSTSD